MVALGKVHEGCLFRRAMRAVPDERVVAFHRDAVAVGTLHVQQIQALGGNTQQSLELEGVGFLPVAARSMSKPRIMPPWTRRPSFNSASDSQWCLSLRFWAFADREKEIFMAHESVKNNSYSRPGTVQWRAAVGFWPPPR